MLTRKATPGHTPKTVTRRRMNEDGKWEKVPPVRSPIMVETEFHRSVEDTFVVTDEVGDKIVVSPTKPRGFRHAWGVLWGRYEPQVVVHQERNITDLTYALFHDGIRAPAKRWDHEPITRETLGDYLVKPDPRNGEEYTWNKEKGKFEPVKDEENPSPDKENDD